MKYKKLIFFVICFLTSKVTFSETSSCEKHKIINIGLVENSYIDYKTYLHYFIGKYSLNIENFEYEISNISEENGNFDFIFGEYNDLKQFELSELKLPENIKNFYDNNEINIDKNLLPLDLDSYILLSKENIKLNNLEELANLSSRFKYTIGFSLMDKRNIHVIWNSIIEQKDFIKSDMHAESGAINLKKIVKNSNKNILENDLLGVYDSYIENENIYTLFSDAILLYKNVDYKHFLSFPKSNYKWDNNLGIYTSQKNYNPTSFFGFSVIVNKPNKLGFICFLTQEEIREQTFRDFNVEIGPLSLNELKKIEENLNPAHLELLENKNKSINKTKIKDYENLINFILNDYELKNLIKDRNYINSNF